jgi:ADP-heptose:LPS heptosyltransferase
MAHILVIRISAIGDVAMTIPVIYSAAKANPNDTFTVVTQAFLKPIFMHCPSNVEVVSINTKGREKKLSGLLRFAVALGRQDFDMVLDLHDVLRTKIIRNYFKFKCIPVFVYGKERTGRAKLTVQSDSKTITPLRPVVERYADVFRRAGLNYTEAFTSLFQDVPADIAKMETLVGRKSGKWIGIAPFAKHRGKIYPADKMEALIEALASQPNVDIFLFGGKGPEEIVINKFAQAHANVHSAVARYSLDTELSLISELDVLVSMDSANMHFASLVNTPVVSIWGATHPAVGFYGYHQDPANIVQATLPCRPCSVFGDKACYKGTWECLEGLDVKVVIDKITKILTK